ncbi:hypothetical protein A8L34_28045 [Bacillus sp. FJAT-27264]|uniref:hypothetical protein n=1 Tax=Paenibacillus sp. (strain DSM 101736 / FJAT-27264) TaxID=1850362 RepID=UPI000807E04F|nr:hypothetical protein [Bacillus sp. FJAT-27264]OBZ15901.1 hypothetical protein A8L34_28045 [Bacillus sp. FJAT-27264]
MEFKVQRFDRRNGNDHTISIEGLDLKEAVTRNIKRISAVTHYYGEPVLYPATARLIWKQTSPDDTKKFKGSPDGTLREYTEEEYKASRGYILLKLKWEEDGQDKVREVTIYGEEKDVQGIEPWELEGK